ncbi:MAG: sugar phosphate isomerase/epimerase [Clostridiales bacterium]|nr:sugar phosphate isomerase/epimerase [Clostridiales bacterium]
MKLGVSSYSFSTYLAQTNATYFDLCTLSKEIGFDAIEFIDLDLRYGTGQKDLLTLAKDLKAHCGQIDLAICAYTVGADFLSGSGGNPQKEVERLKKCIDIAKAMGSPLLRHDIAWGYTTTTKSYRDIIAFALPYIRQVADYGQENGLRTCTENHGYILQDAQRVEELILAVNHDNFGWLIDIGNFACADQPSEVAVGIAAPYAFHVHAKDFLFKPGTAQAPGPSFFPTRGGNHLRGTVAGHGMIPLRQCVQIIKASGYEGYLSLEFEGMEETLPAIKEGFHYLKKLV